MAIALASVQRPYNPFIDANIGRMIVDDSLPLFGDSLAASNHAARTGALGGKVLIFAHTVNNLTPAGDSRGVPVLAGGPEVLFSPIGNGHQYVQADKGAAASGIDGKGRVQAALAELKAAGGNIYGLAVNSAGVVPANRIQKVGGRTYLTAPGDGVPANDRLLTKTGGVKAGTDPAAVKRALVAMP
jgi:hypothetical protein